MGCCASKPDGPSPTPTGNSVYPIKPKSDLEIKTKICKGNCSEKMESMVISNPKFKTNPNHLSSTSRSQD